MKILCFFILNFFILATSGENTNENQNNLFKAKDCKYEKEPWDDCDLNTGLQKRVLRLKAKSQHLPCEQTKEVTRQCKKACRYTKGAWTECVNGEKSRVDILKTNNVSASFCEQTRLTKKQCKLPSSCKYSKSEWSTCEDSLKNRTLTLVQGDINECEEKKTISKQCNPNKKSKNGKRINRKNKTKNDRNDIKKVEPNNIEDNIEELKN